MLSVVTDEQTTSELRLELDEIVREGARRMLAAALEAEVDDYVAAYGSRARRARPPAGGPQRPRRASGTSPPRPARSRSARRGSTTAGSTR